MKITLLFFLFINILNAMTFKEVYTIKSVEGTMKTISAYKELAKKNDPKALHELGLIYLKGDGIAKNLNQAYEYFQQASDLGNAESTYLLGKIYLSNKTKYYNPKKAYNTFIDASNKNPLKDDGLNPKLAPFKLNLGTASGSDIESECGELAGEIFAAVAPTSNQKLKKDINKVLATNARLKFVFFMCPNFELGRQPKLERDGVIIWALKGANRI